MPCRPLFWRVAFPTRRSTSQSGDERHAWLRQLVSRTSDRHSRGTDSAALAIAYPDASGLVRSEGVLLRIELFGPLELPQALEGEVHQTHHLRVTDGYGLEAGGSG